MTALLPLLLNWKAWLAGLIAALLVMVAVDGFRIKRANAELKATHAQLAQAQAYAALKARQASVSGKIDAQQAADQQAVQTVYRTLTKDVILYVPLETDARCIVPNSVVRLLDAGATGLSLPDAPSLADASPSAFRLSDLASNALANDAAKKANDVRLAALQDWVRQQQALNP